MYMKKVKRSVIIISIVMAVICLWVFFNSVIAIEFKSFDVEVLEYFEDDESLFHYYTTEHSTGAVVAEFVKYYEENNERQVWEFRKESVIYGEVPENQILIVEMNGSGPSETAYNVGERYLLFLNRNNSVFYETARYTSLGDLVFSMDNRGFAVWNKGTITYNKFANEKHILNYFKNKSNDVGFLDDQIQKKAIRQESFETVIKECDFVLKIKVISKSVDGILYPSSTFSCEITEILKGEDFVGVSDNYSITVFRDAIKEGEEYIIAAFNVVTKNEIAYEFYQAAENGIISVNDTEKVEIVYDLLKKSK